MAEIIVYEYSLLRYVPDIERQEFVNVGLMMMSKRYRWLHCELYFNEEKICTCFKNSNIELLKRQLKMFTRQDVPDPDLPVEERYRWMVAVKSAIIQTSPSHPGIISLEEMPTRNEAIILLEEKFKNLFNRLVK